MAEGEKSFPPSETKLQNLREAGIYPTSRDFNSLALIVGALLGLSLSVPDLVALAQKGFSSEALVVEPSLLLSRYFAIGSGLGLKLLLPIVICRILSGMLQSRFHIAWPARSRYYLDEPGWTTMSRRLQVAILSLGKIGLVFFLLFIFFGHASEGNFAEDITQISRASHPVAPSDLQGLRNRLGERIGSALFLGVALASFFGILSLMGARIQFRRDHGMTRSEVEAESREFDVKPEMREARNQRQNGDVNL